MNTDCNTIHETVIKDIVDVVTDVKDADSIKGFLRGRNSSFRSIASASENLTLVFPVICSTNMDISTASMVAKALERKYVTMLQILFSSIAYSDVDNVNDYISKFHTNIKLSNNFDMDELLDISDKLIKDESATENSKRLMDNMINEALTKDRDRYKNKYLPSNVSEHAISDYKIMNNFYGENTILLDNSSEPIEEARRSAAGVQHRREREVRHNSNNNTTRTGSIRNSNNSNANNTITGSNNINHRNSHNINHFNNTNYFGAGGGGGSRTPSYRDMAAGIKDTYDMYNKQIIDTDVKKANELIPTSMIVNFVTLAGENPIAASAVIGVKAKLYPADSMEIVDRIISKHTDNHALNKFIRATTREISFFKDFLFAIDKAKFDAKSSADKSPTGKMWRVLERRSKKSKVRRMLGSKNDASAITALVISQQDAEEIKKTSNINIDNAAVARKIMESYNLIAFVIVDEVNEYAKFLFDSGDDNFETLSFSSLERESSDSTYKKVVNLMTKMK